MPNDLAFDSSVLLAVGDIVVDSSLCPPGISVHIKASNTDPFWQGITLYLGKTGVDLCPVVAMVDFLAVRGVSPGPLFQFQNGSSLNCQQLVLAVCTALENQNFDVSLYCGHSFRIGVAMPAARNGIEDCIIKTLGW